MALTIYDIAQRAGVSITTVSRVLNGKGEISEKTRAKVQRVLDESNYAPSQLAKGLAGKTSKTVGILMADVREVHHAALLYQVEKSLSTRGYSCFVYSLSGQPERLREHLTRLASHRVDGIVLTGSIFAASPYREIILENVQEIPCVSMNASLPGDRFYGVVSDERGAFRYAVDYLANQKGRRHIAFVYGDIHMAEQEKLRGYREGMAQQGLAAHVVEAHSLHTLRGGVKATEEILKNHPETDAILYAVDITAAGGIHALLRAGVRVPEDIAIIGSNNSDYARVCVPAITSFDTRPYLTGRLAAEALMTAMEGGSPQKRRQIACKLVERQST